MSGHARDLARRRISGGLQLVIKRYTNAHCSGSVSGKSDVTRGAVWLALSDGKTLKEIKNKIEIRLIDTELETWENNRKIRIGWLESVRQIATRKRGVIMYFSKSVQNNPTYRQPSAEFAGLSDVFVRAVQE